MQHCYSVWFGSLVTLGEMVLGPRDPRAKLEALDCRPMLAAPSWGELHVNASPHMRHIFFAPSTYRPGRYWLMSRCPGRYWLMSRCASQRALCQQSSPGDLSGHLVNIRETLTPPALPIPFVMRISFS